MSVAFKISGEERKILILAESVIRSESSFIDGVNYRQFSNLPDFHMYQMNN